MAKKKQSGYQKTDLSKTSKSSNNNASSYSDPRPEGYQRTDLTERNKLSKSARNKLESAAKKAALNAMKENRDASPSKAIVSDGQNSTSRTTNVWYSPEAFNAYQSRRKLEEAKKAGSSSPLSQLGDAYNRYNRLVNPVYTTTSPGSQQAMIINAQQREQQARQDAMNKLLGQRSPVSQREVTYNQDQEYRKALEELNRQHVQEAALSNAFGLEDYNTRAQASKASKRAIDEFDASQRYQNAAERLHIWNQYANSNWYKNYNPSSEALSSLEERYRSTPSSTWRKEDQRSRFNRDLYEDVQGSWRKNTPIGKRIIENTQNSYNNVDDVMTDAERKLYSYLYDTVGKEKADEYFDDLYATMERRQTAPVIQNLVDYAAEHPWGGSALSVAYNLSGGISGARQIISDIVNNREINPDSTGFAATNAANQMREKISENMSPFGKFAYGTAMSMFDSLSTSVMGELGTVIMASSAASTTAIDKARNGASNKEIFLSALINGGLEWVTEHSRLERLTGLLFDTKTLKDSGASFRQQIKQLIVEWGKSIPRSGLEEGGEELLSAVGDIIADQILYGDRSELSQAYNAMLANGMSKGEASREIWKNIGAEIGGNVAGGFISGSIMGGGAGALNLALNLGPTAVGTDIRVRQGQDLYSEQGLDGISKLLDDAVYYHIIDQAQAEKLMSDITYETRDGRSVDNIDAANIAAISELVDDYRHGRRVASEVQTPTAPAKTIEQAAQTVAEQQIQNDVSVQEKQTETVPAAQGTQVQQAQTESEQQLQDAQFERLLDSFDNDKDKAAFSYAWEMSDRKNLPEFYQGYMQVRNAAMNGTRSAAEAVRANEGAANIGGIAQQVAFSRGLNIAEGQDENTVINKSGVGLVRAYTQEAYQAAIREAKRNGQSERTIEYQLDVLDRIGKRYNAKIALVNGNETSNGEIEEGTNVIRIRLDALSNSYSHTAMHELGHYIADQNEAEYDLIKGKIRDWMDANNLNMDAEIASYVKQLNMTPEAAEQEVVCDHLMPLLTSKNVLREIMGEETGRSFITKARDFIEEFLGNLKKIMSDVAERRGYTSLAKEMQDTQLIEDLFDIFDKAAKTASENFQQNANVGKSGKVRHNTSTDMLTESDLRANRETIAEMEPVITVSDNFTLPKGGKLVDRIYDAIGSIEETNKYIGEIAITKAGIRYDFSHGYGNEKINAVPAITTVLREGLPVDKAVNWKNRGFDTVLLAAPITIGTEDYLMGTRVRTNDTKTEFELHEVVLINKSTGESFTNGIVDNDVARDSSGGYTKSVLQDIVKGNRIISDAERESIANEQTDTAGEIRNSTSLNMTLMDNAEAYAERTGYKNVEKAVLDTVSKQRQQLADYLIRNEDSLGLPEDVAGNTIWANGSYGKTIENSLICPRSMSAHEFIAAVSEELGRPLTQEEGIYVSQAAAAYVAEAQCLYCYVAMDRLAYNEYMGKYIDARETAIRDVIEKGMPTNEAYEKYLDGRKDTKNQKARFHSWIRAARNGEELITKADLASTDAMARAIARNPQLQAQINDVRKYSQSASWAKKQQGYRAYNGNILKMSDAAIKKLNQMYGLRMYSFSDYSPAYVLENMQMITDAAVKGAKVLAYTKSLDFVKTFGSTGAAINISVFAFDGKSKGIIEDQMYGAPWEEAKALRAKYPNVGITFTATNDALVEWGLQQDWIDVVIPFHLVKTGKVVADLLGYTNFTSESSDIKASDWTKGRDVSSITPSMHHNDKAAYLEACRENHLEPRFKRWIEHDGYMKLVNETRLSADEIQVVQPVFNTENMKAAFDSLKNLEKVGGYTQHVGGSVENMRDIAADTADEVRNGAVEKFREFNRRYSIQERIKNNESVGMGRLFDAEETSLTEKELIKYNKFVENALKGKGYNDTPYVKTGEVSEQLSNRLNKFGIILSKNVEHRILDNDIRHIRSSHGIETDGSIGITDGDIYAIPFILANPDGAYYRETNKGLKGIVYVRNDTDTTYYVEGILENGELIGKQMIKTRLGEVPYQYRNDIKKEKALIGLTDDNGLNSKTADPRSYVQDAGRDRASDESLQQNNDDVKYSTTVNMTPYSEADVKDNKLLQKRVAKYEAINEALRNEFKLTKGVKLSEKAIRSIALKMTKEYALTTGKNQAERQAHIDNLTKDLTELFTYMASDEQVTWDEVYSRGMEIAKREVEAASYFDKETWDQWSDFRKSISGTIRVSEQAAEDIRSKYDSLDGYTKQTGIKVSMSSGTPIDSLFIEMAGIYGEGFFPVDATEPDMPEILADVKKSMSRENMYRSTYTEIMGYNLDEAAHDVFMIMQDAYYSVPEVETFADKKDKQFRQMRARLRNQLEELRQESREALKEAKKQLNADKIKYRQELALAYRMAEGRTVKKVERKYIEGIDRIKMDYEAKLENQEKRLKTSADIEKKQILEKYQKAVSKERDKNDELRARFSRFKADQSWTRWERQQEEQYRKRIDKTASTLYNWITHPNMKEYKYVPDKLKAPIIDLLNTLDYSGRVVEKTKKEMKWREAVLALKDAVSTLARDQSQAFLFQDDILSAFDDYGIMLEAREQLDMMDKDGKLSLNHMMSGELRQLDYILTSIYRGVKDVNKLYRNRMASDVETLGMETIKYTNSRPVVKDRRGLVKWLTTDSMEALTYFKQFGKAGLSIYNELNEGFREAYALLRQVQTDFDNIKKRIGVGDSDIAKWSEQVYSIKLDSGKTVNMTAPQIMEFFALSRRQQGLLHILGDGIKIKNFTAKGKSYAQTDAYRISENDIQRIIGKLDSKQERLISAMQTYLSTVFSSKLNEVSQEMYGVDSFLERMYWPISSDANALRAQEPELMRMFNAMLNSSFTKMVDNRARNAAEIGDAFDTFVGHISAGSKYYGLAIPVQDTMKWFNFKERDGEGHVVPNSEVQRGIERVSGESGKAYFKNLIGDINGITQKSWSTDFGAGWVSRFKAAAVSGKLRVVIQQPTALPKAALIIPVKYIVKTTIGPRHVAEMQEHSAIAWFKAQGNYDIGTGASLKSTLIGGQKLSERIADALMTPAGFADDVTWAHIWESCKAWVKDTTDLEMGSDEFFQEVDKRFTDVIMQTQVVDTVLTRTQMMRSKDTGVKMMTAFMSEPMKGYNMLLRAMQDLRSADSETARKTAYRFAVRTGVVSLVTTLLNAAVTAAYDTSRKRDKDKEWLEQFTKTFVSNTIGDLIPGSNVPGIQDVFADPVANAILSLIYDHKFSIKFEAPSDGRYTALENLSSAIEQWTKYADHTGKWSLYRLISRTATSISDVLGLPYGGTLTSLEHIYNIVSNYLGGEELPMENEYATMATAYQNMYKYLTADNRKAYQDLYDLMLKKKLEKNPDERKAKNEIFKGIRDILVEQDERIAELAEMRFNNNIDSARYKVLKDQLVSEGFTWEMVNGAVNSKVEQLGKESSEEKETKEWAPSEFENSDLYGSIEDALNTGDYSAADMVYESILEFSTAQDPVKNTKKNIWEKFRDEYLSEISAGRGKNYAAMFIRFGYTQEELNDKLTDYAWNTYRLTYFEERDKGIDKTGAMLRKIGLTQKQLDSRYKSYLSDKKKKN